MLDQARARAHELSHPGALFPWRTITGEEASAYYEAGTAQYHINADIMYALRKYVNATGDEEFLFQYGAEMLVETARFWYDLGFFSSRKEGRFCINGVTGPDEYKAVVNNNTYTNLMARENLRYAIEVVERIQPSSRKCWKSSSKDRSAGGQNLRVGEGRQTTCTFPSMPQQESILKTTRSSSGSRGTSKILLPTGIRCCCTTTL
jgi:trehalose/maltose hydrolase-like predicted phosphorylase